MRLWVGILGLVLSYSLLCNGANAKVYVKERTKFYAVSGKTGKQVMVRMIKQGPNVPGVKHALASTQANIKVKKVDVRRKGGRCIIRKADVELLLTYHYPKWRNKRKAKRHIQKRWEQFFAGVVRHEKYHAKLFRQTAQQFQRDLTRITGSVNRNCRDMGPKVQTRLRNLVRANGRKHAAFDRKESRKSAKVRVLQRAFVAAN